MLPGPSAQSSTAASSGAASVASAGYAPVNTRPGPYSRPNRVITAASLRRTTPHPICSRISSTGAYSRGAQPASSTRPPAAAQAQAKVAAVIRSGRGAKLHPCSRRTPCTRTVPVPAPCTRPPHRFRNAARSSISGSRAAPRRVVSPCASAAASSRVSVAPTLGNRRVMSAPCSPAGAVSSRRSPSSCGQAPICTRPARCRSMGRAPMRQPPGSTVCARPSRASSGAQNRMDARIRPAGPAASVPLPGTPSTRTSAPCRSAVQPALRSRARLSATSASSGTPHSRTGPLHSRDAASSGSTLFLAAGTRTVPFSGRPPVMM